MIISRPLPDEFCQGHIGRIGRLNGFTSLDCTISGIQQISNKGSDGNNHLSRIESLSLQCGVSPATYARQHTLISYFAFTDCDAPNWQRTVNQQDALNVGTFPPRLCVRCVEEDLRRHSYSYWRHRHQLPGMYWCIEHDSLLSATSDESDFFNMPHQLLGRALTLTTSLGGRYSGLADVIVQFHKAIELMALEELQINRYQLKRLLWQHLEAMNVHEPNMRSINKTSYLSERFIELLPIDWLASIVPNMHLKRPLQTFQSIDAVIVESSPRRPNSAVIAMFLAMFFAEPRHGLNYIKSALRNSSTT